MKIRGPYELPRDKWAARKRADRLEWITLPVQLSVVVALYFVLGQSQAMKAAWIDDLLAFIPPISYLIARRFTRKEPDQNFPYGYYRAVTVAFFIAAVVISFVGVSLFYESVMKLVRQERIPIGTVDIFGWRIWLGWLMLAALAYSIGTEVVLGHLKRKPAEQLHNKVLYADADMNKAGWLSETSAAIGIVGIGFGLWWADPAAAIIISIEIIRDGWENVSQVFRDLLDEEPRKVGSNEPDPVPEQLRAAAERLPWVKEAAVRLREEGEVLSGEIFVVPRDETHLARKVYQAAYQLKEVHWRLYDLTIMPVPELDAKGPRRVTVEPAARSRGESAGVRARSTETERPG